MKSKDIPKFNYFFLRNGNALKCVSHQTNLKSYGENLQKYFADKFLNSEMRNIFKQKHKFKDFNMFKICDQLFLDDYDFYRPNTTDYIIIFFIKSKRFEDVFLRHLNTVMSIIQKICCCECLL